MQLKKSETRTLMIARYGMLECGRNFGGSMKKMCETCNCIDDEEHRLNICPKWKKNDNSVGNDEVPFVNVFSNDCNVLRAILPRIEELWDTKNAHGTMRK